MKRRKRIFLGSVLASSSLILPFVMSASWQDIPKQKIDTYQHSSVHIPTTKLNFNDWMKYVDGRKRLSDLTIPGTHDSTMFAGTGLKWAFGQHIAKTQSRNFTEQLKSGIRFFDIRINRDLWIYHGIVASPHNFNQVLLNAIVPFLDQHPSETVIIRYKDENEDPKNMSASELNAWNQRINNLLNDPRVNAKLFKNTTGDSYVNPTLDQMRGKIYLMNNMYHTIFNSDYRNAAKYGSLWNQTAGLKIQDQFNVDENTKKQVIKASLDVTAKGQSEYTYINFTSMSHNRSQPWRTAQQLNKWLYDYLKSNESIIRMGIIVFDFPGDTLLERVVKTNYTYSDYELRENFIFDKPSISFTKPYTGDKYITFNPNGGQFKFEITRRIVNDVLKETPTIQSNKIILSSPLKRGEQITINAYQEAPTNNYYHTPKKYNQSSTNYTIEDDPEKRRLLDALKAKITEVRNKLLALRNASSAEINFFDNIINPEYTALDNNYSNSDAVALSNKLIYDSPKLMDAIQTLDSLKTKISNTLNSIVEDEYFTRENFAILSTKLDQIVTKYNEIFSNNEWKDLNFYTSFINDQISPLIKLTELANTLITDDKRISKSLVNSQYNTSLNLRWGFEEFKAKVESEKAKLLESFNKVSQNISLYETERAKYDATLNSLDTFVNFARPYHIKLIQVVDQTNLTSDELSIFKDKYVQDLINQNSTNLDDILEKIKQSNAKKEKYQALLKFFNTFKSKPEYAFAMQNQKENYQSLLTQLTNLTSNFSSWESWDSTTKNVTTDLTNLKNKITSDYQIYNQTKGALKQFLNNANYISPSNKNEFSSNIENTRTLAELNIIKNNLEQLNQFNQSLVTLIEAKSSLNTAQKTALKTLALNNKTSNNLTIQTKTNDLDLLMRQAKKLKKDNSNYQEVVDFKFADPNLKTNFVSKYTQLNKIATENTNFDTSTINSAAEEFKLAKRSLNGEENLDNKKQIVINKLNQLSLSNIIKSYFTNKIDNSFELSEIDSLESTYTKLNDSLILIKSKSNLNSSQKNNLISDLDVYTSETVFNQSTFNTNVNNIDSKMLEFKNKINDFESNLSKFSSENLKYFLNLGKIIVNDEKDNFNNSLLGINEINNELVLIQKIKTVFDDVYQNIENYSSSQVDTKLKELEDLYFSKKIQYFEILLEKNKTNFLDQISSLHTLWGQNEYYSNYYKMQLDKLLNANQNRDITSLKNTIEKVKQLDSNFDSVINQKIIQLKTFKDIADLTKDKIDNFEQNKNKSYDELIEVRKQINVLEFEINLQDTNTINQRRAELEAILSNLDNIFARINQKEQDEETQKQLYAEFVQNQNKFQELLDQINVVQFSDIHAYGLEKAKQYESINENTPSNELRQAIQGLKNNYAEIERKKAQKEELQNTIEQKLNTIAEKMSPLISDVTVVDNNEYIQNWNNLKSTNYLALSFEEAQKFSAKIEEFHINFVKLISANIEVRKKQITTIDKLKSDITNTLNQYPEFTSETEEFSNLVQENVIESKTNAEVDVYIEKLEAFLNKIIERFLTEKSQIIAKNNEILSGFDAFSTTQKQTFNQLNTTNYSIEELKELFVVINTIKNDIATYTQSYLNNQQYKAAKNELGEITNLSNLDTFAKKDKNLKERMKVFQNKRMKVREILRNNTKYNLSEAQTFYNQLFRRYDLDSNLNIDDVNVIISNFDYFLSESDKFLLPDKPAEPVENNNNNNSNVEPEVPNPVVEPNQPTEPETPSNPVEKENNNNTSVDPTPIVTPPTTEPTVEPVIDENKPSKEEKEVTPSTPKEPTEEEKENLPIEQPETQNNNQTKKGLSGLSIALISIFSLLGVISAGLVIKFTKLGQILKGLFKFKK